MNKQFLSQKAKGVIAILLSAFIFGCMPILAKKFYIHGGNASTLIFLRFFLVLPFLYIVLRTQKIPLAISAKELFHLITASILGYCISVFLLFISYDYISVGLATAVHFIYPSLVVLVCIIFFKEKASLIKIAAVLMATTGVFLCGKSGEIASFFGLLIAFLSGVTFAVYVIYIDKSPLRKMNAIKLTFYLCVISAVIMLGYSGIRKELSLEFGIPAWSYALTLSILVSAGAVNLFQYGIKIIGAQNTSILSTIEPITGILLGVAILHEKLDILSISGACLILLAVFLIALGPRK
ncbi:DMT family transporter [Treponema phagedenis]|uniref:DMT family transporter n=1 Tax=Treponema phagedenis TaxID=162 RepID=A0A0B7H1U9_TREPH|nr:DMT family transporter [Treponema phagedenis]NVP24662.1 DMT family transporter [Treponema phagedenis]QEJ95682.1 DMT family transporter [Treponema phagedenis]QEJ97588.1 DMT family transporter [Treponema phagedenis]QEK00555.1 DMT family transporter [Treponema phagedenis]QEK03154.1 DMT family transporter [Treponema phagedenis]